MKKFIISKSLDAGFLAVLYFGLYLEMQWAKNLIIPIAFVMSVLALILIAALSAKEAKESFKKTREPKGFISKCYSITYDVFVAGCMAAGGYQVTGVIWFILMLLAWIVTSSVDDEIRKERKEALQAD